QIGVAQEHAVAVAADRDVDVAAGDRLEAVDPGRDVLDAQVGGVGVEVFVEDALLDPERQRRVGDLRGHAGKFDGVAVGRVRSLAGAARGQGERRDAGEGRQGGGRSVRGHRAPSWWVPESAPGWPPGRWARSRWSSSRARWSAKSAAARLRGRGRSMASTVRMRPGRGVMTTTSSASTIASSMSWVTRTVVVALSRQTS